MKIEKVSISRTIPTGPYMNDKIGMEASLEDGETPESALTELNKRVTEWHRAEHPRLYQNGAAPTFEELSYTRGPASVLAPAPVIDYKLIEDLEKAIDNAQTIDELKSIKEQNPIMPAKLIDQYNKRLKELTNGK